MKQLTRIISDPLARNNLEQRYWPKVDRRGENECWNWQAKARHPYGYGRMSAGRNIHLKAHQIGWTLENGPIPEGMFVCHQCDNPRCCNPAHLFLGDQSANMRDAKAKGRMSKPPIRTGQDHHNTKLTNQQIAAIFLDKRSASAVASDYGVSTKTVYRVRWGKRTES